MDAPEFPCAWCKRRVEEFGSSQDHGLTMVDATDHGKPITTSFFIFLRCAVEDAPFFWCLNGMFQG